MKRNLQFSAAMRKFKLVSWILAVLCFSKCSEGSSSQLYSVVEALGNNCPASESCKSIDVVPEAQNNYTCACDHRCTEYDDCCIDGPRRLLKKKHVTCVEVEDQEGVFMIDSCPREYNGSDIFRKLCDLIYVGYQPNPMVARPITDISKGITYKNSYCFACNEDMESVLERKYSFSIWPLKWGCSHPPQLSYFPEIEDIPMFTLMYLDHYWPVHDDRHINGSYTWFEGCDIVPKLPSHDNIRRCRPNLVSDCPTSWKDENVRSMCKYYTGARYDHHGRGYRNVHCAICNGADVTQLSCLPSKRTDTIPYLENSWYAQMEAVKEKMMKCTTINDRDRYCQPYRKIFRHIFKHV